jgi:hypothetical protein
MIKCARRQRKTIYESIAGIGCTLEESIPKHHQMNRVTPQMRSMATALIAYESRHNKTSEAKSTLGFHVCEKLRPQLAILMGNGGFRALVSRALTIANEEVPWLRRVHVKSDGSLEAVGKLKAQISADQIAEGRVVLLAQLLGLLVAFIGENLTLQILHDVWPKALITAGDSANGGKNEKKQ